MKRVIFKRVGFKNNFESPTQQKIQAYTKKTQPLFGCLPLIEESYEQKGGGSSNLKSLTFSSSDPCFAFLQPWVVVVAWGVVVIKSNLAKIEEASFTMRSS